MIHLMGEVIRFLLSFEKKCALLRYNQAMCTTWVIIIWLYFCQPHMSNKSKKIGRKVLYQNVFAPMLSHCFANSLQIENNFPSNMTFMSYIYDFVNILYRHHGGVPQFT